VVSGGGDGREAPTGLKPGALTDLLRQVAAGPSEREAELPPLLPGTVLGHFEVLRELGRGGFGVVYEARDRELGRQVALKLVRPGGVTEEESKVPREAEAIARLSHPNLITLYDVGRSDGRPYLVFELLHGKTLQQRMDDGPMPVQEAVHVAVEVARGLAHAHTEGVVHRDLKPANVFVTNRGQVKILDFGMAHAFGRRRLSGGTPAYMAPEQWEDDPEDERTDVFALGVMLHVMLSGEYPFPEGEGRWSAAPAAAPKLDLPGAPRLADVVERMVDRTPKGRPRDGAAVLAALTPIEDALRTKPADGSPPVHATRRKASLRDLLTELKRRRVVRVMVGYGIFAFAALQVTEPIMHGANLPDWVLTAVLVALAAGLPVAVILAWVFDLTAQGVKRTPSATASDADAFSRSRLAMLLVGMALLAALPGVGWYLWKQSRDQGQGSTSVASPPAVAVLPFDDMSPGHDQGYFADGMAEEILNALAQVEGLRVAGRTSSFHYRGKAAKLGDIGRELNVGTVLEGSVRKDGGRIRITAQLVKTSDGFHLWSQTFDRDHAGVFAVQEEIARAVVEALRVRLLHGAVAPRAGGTASKEAYDQFLRGRDLLRTRATDSFEPALAAFEKAVSLDPGYAQGWAGIADAIAFIDGVSGQGPSTERRRRWVAAADRAVALAPDQVAGYLVRGYLRGWLQHDWQGAQADLDRARSLGPGRPDVAILRGRVLIATGRVLEAVVALEEATASDPLSSLAFQWLGQAHLSSGDGARARASLERALELAPRGDSTRYYLCVTLLAGGQPELALAVGQQATLPWVRLTCVALAHQALGHVPEARAALDTLVGSNAFDSPYQIAEIQARRGELDLAFQWLERARVEKDPGIGWIKTDPLLKALRGDPRYALLLRRMHLPLD
jgi:TolB-like protein/predicted Ser/Thr protein kinase